MSEKILVPKRVSVKTKPNGGVDQLFITVQAENTLQFLTDFSAYVTRELCMIILEFLEQQKYMQCVFEDDKLICVKDRLNSSKKYHDLTKNSSPFPGIPIGATFYSTRSNINLFAYIKVGEKTLTGYVSTTWVYNVINALVDKLELIFQVEDDKKGRENFKSIVEGQIPPLFSSASSLAHVAYFDK